MAQPAWIGSGATPQKSDTRRILKVKLLGAIQNLQVAPLAKYNPLHNDTLARLDWKIANAMALIP